jgi:aspartate racemase
MSKIVIIGGMGPQASLGLHGLIIEKAARSGSVDGDEFPEIVHLSIPVPDFLSPGSDKKPAMRRVRASLKGVNFNGTDVVTIACNTAHLLIDEFQEMAGIGFVSMIDTVSRAASFKNFSKVGILASPTTIQTGLYKEALSARQIECVEPSKAQQAGIEHVIRRVISGSASEADSLVLDELANNLVDRGAQAVVLGCTELPLIFPKSFSKVPILNSLDLIADELLKRYNKSNT